MNDHVDNVIDLNAILHPGSVYDHPRDVVADAKLSIAEKRAILASWASDAAAVASNPALREIPGSRCLVTVDEVLQALAALAGDSPRNPPGGRPNRLKSISRIAMAA
jgi:hypothetical protein